MVNKEDLRFINNPDNKSQWRVNAHGVTVAEIQDGDGHMVTTKAGTFQAKNREEVFDGIMSRVNQ